MVTVKESVPEHSMLQVPDWCDWSGSLHLETARNARSVGPLWPFDTPSVLLVGSAMKTTFPTAQKHEIGQRKSTNRMSCQIDLALRVETWQHKKLCRCKAWIKIWWFPRVLKCLAWSNGVNDVHLCHRQAFWATGFHCFQTRKPWKIPDPDPDTPTSQLFGRSRASFKSTKPFKSNGTQKNYRNFITNQQLIYVHITILGTNMYYPTISTYFKNFRHRRLDVAVVGEVKVRVVTLRLRQGTHLQRPVGVPKKGGLKPPTMTFMAHDSWYIWWYLMISDDIW